MHAVKALTDIRARARNVEWPSFLYRVLQIVALAHLVPYLVLTADWLLHPLEPSASQLAGTMSPIVRALFVLLLGPLTLISGVLVLRKTPGNIIGLLLIIWSASLLLFTARSDLDFLVRMTTNFRVWFLPLVILPIVFPNGRGPVRGVDLLLTAYVILNVTLGAVDLAAESTMAQFGLAAANPFYLDMAAAVRPGIVQVWSLFDNLISVPLVVLVLVAPIVHYRRGNMREREQIKWFVLSAIVVGVLMVTYYISVLIYGAEWVNAPPAFKAIFLFVVMAYFGVFPSVPVAYAILRHRLYGIDIIIHRTLVYGILTMIIVGAYVLIVVGLGSLFSVGNSLLPSLLATTLVAVAFQPLREQVQRRVNRLMYGERDEPGHILARLGQQIENVITHEKLLPSIVETVARSLKLPFVQIEWAHQIEADNGGTNGSTPAASVAASYGTPLHTSANLLRIPLVYQSEVVGQLVLAPRARTDGFSPTDHRTLQALAQQIGLAAHAVRLTHDLQRSREQLVTAREEERRRLRRDLHDGLGPALSSVLLRLGAARRQLPPNSGADRLIIEARDDLRNAIADIRRLVSDLRPPVLDQLGLTTAIRDFAESCSSRDDVGTHVTVELPEALPPLSAAVEVALYRIMQEAVTNVVRHASAYKCTVRLAVEETQDRYVLNLDVSDNGVGLPSRHAAGVGLSSMRERAEELSGSFHIESPPGQGTRLLAAIPMSKE
jgi:two-component system NarL family sensor kinase